MLQIFYRKMGKKGWGASIVIKPTDNKEPNKKAKYICIYKVDEISSWIELLHTFNKLPPSHMLAINFHTSMIFLTIVIIVAAEVSEDSWKCLQKNINTR